MLNSKVQVMDVREEGVGGSGTGGVASTQPRSAVTSPFVKEDGGLVWVG